MLKQEILELIDNFERETWKYSSNDSLDDSMNYIYSLAKEIERVDEADLKPIYDRLVAIIGIIRFEYGFESEIIKSNPELENLRQIIDNISLSSGDIIRQYNNVSIMFNNYISKIKDGSFIKNKYENTPGEEGLYLAIESLKSLISNESYRQLLTKEQINDVIIDCIKLNNGSISLKSLELKYKEIIKQIWEHSLSDKVADNGSFRMLFSNISGDALKNKADMLLNRQFQTSCSLISSDFVAIYGSGTRRIGFIYPSNSEIIMASAYDLGSNVFGEGVVNKEKGTTIVTPQVLERIGKERTTKNGEDIYSSNCYNEILVNAKPCGIAVIGLGENDLNIDYQEAKALSMQMGLPIYYIDTMQYKEELSDNDKYYIAFHSIMSYLGMSRDDLLKLDDNKDIYNLIEKYKEQLADIFMTLKKEGTLSRDNMCQMMNDIIDVSEIKTR